MNVFKTILILILLVSITFPQNLVKATLGFDSQAAQTYLLSQTNSPWQTMALSALGANNFSTDYLKTANPGTASDVEAVVLAIASLGQDPRTFGANNLVQKLLTFQNSNQLGDASTVNDDIFGILALLSAGELPSSVAVQNSENFILQNQKQNGGFGWAVSGGADSDTTAAAIVALKAAGLNSTDSKIQNALNFLKSNQTSDGGIAPDPTQSWGQVSSVSTTAWALWALNALSIDAATWDKGGSNPKSFLISKQSPNGSIDDTQTSFTPIATSYSVIALLGKTLPLKITQQTLPQFAFRIEGLSDTICEGKAPGPTALDIVKNASNLCGFTYHIKDTSFGPYLDQIGNDQASGSVGWQYAVNWNAPSTGAADYQLQNNDDVLWYFGDFDAKLARLTLNPTEINSGGNAQATLESPSGSSWLPIDTATITVGTQNFSTDSSGKTNVSSSDGYYKVFGKKTGYIKSNNVLLKIGSPATGNVSLSANIDASQVEGTSTASTISFTVSPSNLDFGNISKGQNVQKTLSINNTGSVAISVGAVVSGDSVFTDNLSLDGKIWKNFALSLVQAQKHDTSASLTVPASYIGNGPKNGTLVIWASPK